MVSHMNRMLRPREQAVRLLVEALAHDILDLAAQTDIQTDLQAAKANWEAMCGVSG